MKRTSLALSIIATLILIAKLLAADSEAPATPAETDSPAAAKTNAASPVPLEKLQGPPVATNPPAPTVPHKLLSSPATIDPQPSFEDGLRIGAMLARRNPDLNRIDIIAAMGRDIWHQELIQFRQQRQVPLKP